ncbi:type I restriction modification DNA specificity domain-containing protein [Campylobacter devanensis]|uniref:Type I restriction/modification system, S subunit n=1 Tax=Campylobacter devanensis TaxID=3161138 RepID=A0A1X9SQ97_9BACT|nr:restriction endonuclease subunit S [Campylobacter lanienae]ARQ98416.1 type I restriction/modification system, S subunit [Campylobacter lanienae]SUX01396.1 type I restriction modification DNA specificity domain-containing protein [Campylobacter lanienae]
MSKLEELINKLCPNGVEFKTIGELFDVRNGYTPSKNNDEYWENGDISWYRMEDIRANGKILNDSIQHITKKAVKNKLFPKNSLMVATTATIGIHALIKNDFVCNQQLTCVSIKEKNKEKLNIKFCFYYFDIIDEECVRIANQGGGMPIVSLEKMKKLRFPVPPLEVQCEIVRILDNFTLLSAELSARQKQYEYYSKELFNFNDDVEFISLESIADIGTGSSNTNEAVEDGQYPFYVRSQQVYYKNNYEYDDNSIITSGDGVGVGKIFHYTDGKYALHQRAYRINITNNKVNSKYFYYYMKSTFYDYIQKNAFNSSVTSIRRPMLNKYPVPILSLEKQNKIVNILEKFEKLCNDISEGLPAEIEARKSNMSIIEINY